MKIKFPKQAAFVLSLALALSLLTGCGSKTPAVDSSPADGAESLEPDTSFQEETPSGSHFQTYDEVLDAIQKGLSAGEDAEYYAKLGLNVGFVTYAQELEGEVDEYGEPLRFGYSLLDLDGDGTDELVVGIRFAEMPIVLDVFGQSESGVSLLFSSEGDSRWYLGENNEIYNFILPETGTSYYCRYQMSEHEMILGRALFYYPGEDPEKPWCCSSTGFEPEDAKRVTEEEAQELLEELWPVDLDLQLFEE